jgi:hypothetical protein
MWTNSFGSKLTPAQESIYQDAHFYFVEKNMPMPNLEEKINQFICSSTIDEKDVFLALKILQVHPDTQKLYFLGFLMFVLELPPFWELFYDVNLEKAFFSFKVRLVAKFYPSGPPALHKVSRLLERLFYRLGRSAEHQAECR